MPERRRLVLTPIGDDPEVGRWLAALEDGRADTLKELAGVSAEMVDWYPTAPLNSIGSLLYHIALIEAAWVAEEILEVGEPDELAALLPWSDRESEGGVGNQRHLSRIDGLPLEQHIGRLAAIRRWVLEQLKPMTNDDFHRVRSFDDYDAAPDWVLHHILQHEAEHRSHIAWLRDTFAARAND
jgi:DinB superfamily